MTTKQKPGLADAGAEIFETWRATQHADPEYQAYYDEEAPKFELWLRLAGVRNTAKMSYKKMATLLGVSVHQAKALYDHGYDIATLDELRRYTEALEDAVGLPSPDEQ